MYLLYNNDVQAVSSDYYIVDDKENIIRRENSQKNPIGCAIMFRIEKLIEIGLYDSSFRMHEEKDLRIRFLKKNVIARLPIPLYRYRKHENNMTNDSKKMKFHYKKLKRKHKL